jgi:hypothetical protein
MNGEGGGWSRGCDITGMDGMIAMVSECWQCCTAVVVSQEELVLFDSAESTRTVMHLGPLVL